MTVLVTGAAGRIGRVLTPALVHAGFDVRLTDVAPINDAPAGCEISHADLRDFPQVMVVTAGVSAVVHLAGISDEAPFPAIAEHNITATYHVLEAARQRQTPRVVLASSNHVTGFYPCRETIGPDHPVRPDSFYGVGKATLEALGYLYARKYGLKVVCLRIGSFEPRPQGPRHAATWLSHRDGAQLFLTALRAPLGDDRFLVTYGTSDNPDSWWRRDGWDTLGYQPRDTAHRDSRIDPDDVQGGHFAGKEPPGQPPMPDAQNSNESLDLISQRTHLTVTEAVYGY